MGVLNFFSKIKAVVFVMPSQFAFMLKESRCQGIKIPSMYWSILTNVFVCFGQWFFSQQQIGQNLKKGQVFQDGKSLAKNKAFS